MRVGRRRETAPQVLDDRAPIDGVGECLPDANVGQRRIAGG